MYTDTITLFNRFGKESTGFTWFPTVLRSVDLNIDKGAQIQRMGTDKADTAKLHIKYVKEGEIVVVGSKEYLPPKEWINRKKESTTLTFNEGIDFFILGEYPEVPIKDDYYISRAGANGFFDHLNRSKDFVFKITNVGLYKLIPHFEIGGA